MAHRIAAAAARLTRLVTGEEARHERVSLALILRVENAQVLRASLGPAMFEQILERLTARLGNELRLLPQSRTPGSAEIMGVFAAGNKQAVPGLLARLQVICNSAINLPDIRICPVVNGAIIYDDAGGHDPGALHDFGRAALQGCDPLSPAGQLRFVEMPAQASGADRPVARSIAPDRFAVLFQPQLCCDTGAVQALRVVPQIRISQDDQCDLATIEPRLHDETLADIGAQVLRAALTALRGWDRLGARVPVMSLPVSDRQLADPTLADTILWELDRLDLSPGRLEIEISEPLGKTGGRLPVTSSLERLSGAGCRLALGDFATGSAGLDELRRYGIKRVRVGREFIAGCDRRSDQQRMILAILALAEHLRLTTLADGVTTPEEHAFLSQIGFDGVQGPAIAAAMDAGSTDDFLFGHLQSLPQPFDLRRRV